MNDNILTWLQQWYLSQCDGEWEHGYGVAIGTLDNPGWSIKIDLEFTDLEEIQVDTGIVEKSEHDWYIYRTKDKKFEAYGDPSKLEFLLLQFKEFVENNK